MESIITNFHIDIRLIIAQMINFGLVALCIWWFVLKPLTSVMGERTKTIEHSLAQAKDIEERIKKTAQEQTAILADARQQAQAIIETAESRATDQHRQAMQSAKLEVEKIVTQGKQALATEKAIMLQQAQQELTEIVVASTEKLVGRVADKQLNQQFVEQTIQQLTKPAKAKR